MCIKVRRLGVPECVCAALIIMWEWECCMCHVCEDVLRKMKAEHGGTTFSIMTVTLEFKRCFYHQTRNRCNHNNSMLIRSQSLFMKPCGAAA